MSEIFTPTNPREVLEREPSIANVARISREQASQYATRIANGEDVGRAEFLARNPKVMAEQYGRADYDKLKVETQKTILDSAMIALDLKGKDYKDLSAREIIEQGTGFIQKTLYDRTPMSVAQERIFAGCFEQAVTAFADASEQLGSYPGAIEAKYYAGNVIGSLEN